ncbi:MAG: LLM class flavin-dependent oxidoreductase [Dehalococcoidia bacterium]
MRFGIFTTVHDSAGEATTAAQLLDNLREQVVLAEELGFDAVWLGEHHFGPYEPGDIPNPILLGADLAACTSQIRIGQMANIAVWWHPIRLAEDLAILDNLTKGRVEVGFGRGIWPYEGPQFHPNADPSKEENRELFRETLEVVKKAWTQEYFSHQGANYTFPAPGTVFSHPQYPSNPEWQDGDRVLKLRVTPKPYQKPHPPVWMTVSTDRSVGTAAELGLKACYWQPPPLRVKKRMQLYAEIRSEREGRSFKMGEDQAVMRHTYVASSMEEARRDAETGVMSAFIFNDPFRGREVFTNPGEELQPGTKLDWDFLEPRTLLVGPPDHVAEKVHELQEVCNLNYLILAYAHGGVPQKKTLRNLELFATKVMPLFKGSQEEKLDSATAS